MAHDGDGAERAQNEDRLICFSLLIRFFADWRLEGDGIGGGELHTLRRLPSVMCSRDLKGWHPSLLLVSGASQRQLDPIESSADIQMAARFSLEDLCPQGCDAACSSWSSRFQRDRMLGATDPKNATRSVIFVPWSLVVSLCVAQG